MQNFNSKYFRKCRKDKCLLNDYFKETINNKNISEIVKTEILKEYKEHLKICKKIKESC